MRPRPPSSTDFPPVPPLPDSRFLTTTAASEFLRGLPPTELTGVAYTMAFWCREGAERLQALAAQFQGSPMGEELLFVFQCLWFATMLQRASSRDMLTIDAVSGCAYHTFVMTHQKVRHFPRRYDVEELPIHFATDPGPAASR